MTVRELTGASGLPTFGYGSFLARALSSRIRACAKNHVAVLGDRSGREKRRREIELRWGHVPGVGGRNHRNPAPIRPYR
jgi:hypothetical protein